MRQKKKKKPSAHNFKPWVHFKSSVKFKNQRVVKCQLSIMEVELFILLVTFRQARLTEEGPVRWAHLVPWPSHPVTKPSCHHGPRTMVFESQWQQAAAYSTLPGSGLNCDLVVGPEISYLIPAPCSGTVWIHKHPRCLVHVHVYWHTSNRCISGFCVYGNWRGGHFSPRQLSIHVESANMDFIQK